MGNINETNLEWRRENNTRYYNKYGPPKSIYDMAVSEWKSEVSDLVRVYGENGERSATLFVARERES